MCEEWWWEEGWEVGVGEEEVEGFGAGCGGGEVGEERGEG